MYIYHVSQVYIHMNVDLRAKVVEHSAIKIDQKRRLNNSIGIRKRTKMLHPLKKKQLVMNSQKGSWGFVYESNGTRNRIEKKRNHRVNGRQGFDSLKSRVT